MKTIESLESEFKESGIHVHRPHVGLLIDDLIKLAKQYRSDAKHDRNAIRAMRGIK